MSRVGEVAQGELWAKICRCLLIFGNAHMVWLWTVLDGWLRKCGDDAPNLV